MKGSGSEGGTPDSSDGPPQVCNQDPTSDVEFTHAGLDCLVIHTEMGHWCGYVCLPEDVEPVRWTSDYDSKHDEILKAEVDVFGGITYGPKDGWVGFDDGHAEDIVDHRDEGTAREAVKAETKRLADQIVELIDAYGGKGQFSTRVDEIAHDALSELEESNPDEAVLYARCCAAFEDAVNGTDLPSENALGVMTAALFEGADRSGYDRVDVIETANEFVDEGGDADE